MKAAVFHGSQNMTVEDVPYPQLRPDGVIIKVNSSGICGSDLHMYRHGGPDGLIMGHEFSGDVVEIGDQVKGVKVGDRVIAIGGVGCGDCYWCKQGDYIRCSRLRFIGVSLPGSNAEYISIPLFELDRYAVKLPDSISYEVGATAEPLSVALYAVDQTQPQPGDTVVVTGLGIIGICLVQILKSRGITRIIASGRRKKRLELAEQSGASVVVDAARDDIVPVVEKETAGKKAEVVFECAGAASAFHQALQMVHRGGKVNLVGLYQESITWNPSFIISNDMTIIGCGLRWNLPGAVDLLQSGKVDTRPMITHEFPLADVKEAFDTQVEADDAIKVLLKP